MSPSIRSIIAGIMAAAISASPNVAARESCISDHCHDGDTCTHVCAGECVMVRLHCIDAPEMAQAPWGAASGKSKACSKKSALAGRR